MKVILKLLSIISIPFIIGLSMPDSNKPIRSGEIIADNPDHLDGAFTGGFGEETCRSCHFDYDLNMDGGNLSLEGLSDSYEPGKEYNITVALQAEQLEIGGFQLTTRFEDGNQAGDYSWDGDQLMFTPSISDEVKYLQHTTESTAPTGDQKIQWSFVWTAPDRPKGNIVVNLAANSGNYDDSSFGDWIYSRELTLTPH